MGIALDCTKIPVRFETPSENASEETVQVDFSEFQFEDGDEDDENVISLEKLINDIKGKEEPESASDKGMSLLEEVFK